MCTSVRMAMAVWRNEAIMTIKHAHVPFILECDIFIKHPLNLWSLTQRIYTHTHRVQKVTHDGQHDVDIQTEWTTADERARALARCIYVPIYACMRFFVAVAVVVVVVVNTSTWLFVVDSNNRKKKRKKRVVSTLHTYAYE